MTTILLADDSPLVRRNVRRLLETDPDLSVVGESSNGVETIHLLQQLQPDILVFDLEMPGLAALQVIEQARQVSPRTNLVILSMHLHEWYILQTLKSGASAYVFKTQVTDDLLPAIHEAADGRRFVSSPASQREVNEKTLLAEAGMLSPYETLTSRERELIRLIADGYTNAQVAEQLSIGLRAVHSRRANVMRKLGLSTQASLVVYALRYALSEGGSAEGQRA